MYENNPMFVLPTQSPNDLQDLLMCETYFDDPTNLNPPGTNASSLPPNVISDFDAQIQALLAANTDLGSSNASDFANLTSLQWGLENESISSPENATLFTPDILSLSSPECLAQTHSLINSPHSYTTGDDMDSMDALSPPSFNNLTEFNPEFSNFPGTFDQLIRTERESTAAVVQVENGRKRQPTDDDTPVVHEDDGDKIKNKKRKSSNISKTYRKSSNPSPNKISEKEQYVKDEPIDPTSNPNALVQGMRVPTLCLDGSVGITGAQSIVIPGSPTGSAGVTSNYNTTALLSLGQGVWPGVPQNVSQETSYATSISSNDIQNGLIDASGQFSNNTTTKLPITRLKPPIGSQPANNFQAQPNKQQKKVAHNAIERRYRNNINDRINDLKNVVPALCHLKSKDNRDDDEDDEVDGIPAATKSNKATILRKATEYILYLKKNNRQVKEENDVMKKVIETLPGGVELYNVYRRDKRGRNESPSSDEGHSPIPSSPHTQKGSDSDTSGSRVLMALFMCMTFFTSPLDYGQKALGGENVSEPHHHEGRAWGESTSGDIAAPNTGFTVNDGIIKIDLWYLVRIMTFILCITYILRPSIFSTQSRRIRKSKVIDSVLTSKTRDKKVLYNSLSSLVSPSPTNFMEVFIGLVTELFKFFMRRFIGWDITGGYAVQDLEDRLSEISLWRRLGEVELCGGNERASRFSIAYSAFRTINLLETTHTTRKHILKSSSCIYANAALQCYISFQAIPFIAQKAAAHFWQRAINQKGRGDPVEKWIDIALSCDQNSDLWKDVVNRISEHAFQPQTRKEISNNEIKGITVPLAYVSDAQALFLLKDAYCNFISVRYGGKMLKEGQLTFQELLNVTSPASLTHWYTLVGCAITAFSVGNNVAGEKLMNRMKEDYPKSDSNANKQIIAMSLLSYALLMHGKVEASVRCAEKASVAINRRNKEEKNTAENSLFTDGQSYDEIKMMERGIHDLAEFCVGWIVLEARVLGWKIIEELSAENKALVLPEVLDIELQLKPGVQDWIKYLRRWVNKEVFEGIEKTRREFLKQLDALTRVVGGIEECSDEDQAEGENPAVRAWCVLKGM